MKAKQHIRSSEAALVIFWRTVGTIYFPMAALVIPVAGAAGWWTVLLAFLLAGPWILLAVWLGKQGGAANLGQAAREWLGPYLGFLLLLWFAVYWLMLAGGVLAEVTYVFHSIALPATPTPVLLFSLLFLIVYSDLQGLQASMRVIQAVLQVALPLAFAFFLAGLASSKFSNLLPLYGESWRSLSKAVYLASPYPMEGVLLTFFLATGVSEQTGLAKKSLIGVWLAGAFLALTVAITSGVLGMGIPEGSLYSTVFLAQSISVGNTLVGVELFVYPLWLLSGYADMAVSFVLASAIVGYLCPWLKSPWRSFVVGMAVSVVGLWPPNLLATMKLLSKTDYYLGQPFYIVLPVLALWVALKRRKSA